MPSASWAIDSEPIRARAIIVPDRGLSLLRNQLENGLEYGARRDSPAMRSKNKSTSANQGQENKDNKIKHLRNVQKTEIP